MLIFFKVDLYNLSLLINYSAIRVGNLFKFHIYCNFHNKYRQIYRKREFFRSQKLFTNFFILRMFFFIFSFDEKLSMKVLER